MHDAEVEVKEGNAAIEIKQEIPKQFQDEFKKIINRTIPEIKNVEFNVKSEKE